MIIFIASLFNVFFGILAPAAPEAATVQVTISEIENPKNGSFIALLWATDDGFPLQSAKAAFRAEAKASGSEVTLEFTGVPPGTYAISVFQDENEDGEINRNFIGMPKEPVGLSNYDSLGRPKFSKAAVEIVDGQQSFSVRLMKQ